VLDEPTAGLDPKHAHELIQMSRGLRGPTTVLISSHNLSELEEICDRAAIRSKGEIVRQGTMNDILRADNEVHIFLGDGPDFDPGAVQAPNVRVALDKATRRLTLRIEGDGIDRVTTDALKRIIDAGQTIREVSRGQSLLSTYLEVSKTA
jgi:ABC-type multidrug transport system ATPase subunit